MLQVLVEINDKGQLRMQSNVPNKIMLRGILATAMAALDQPQGQDDTPPILIAKGGLPKVNGSK